MSRAQQCEQQISVTMLMKAATLQLLSFKFTLATVRRTRDNEAGTPPSGHDTSPHRGALDGPKIDSQLEL
ncbi:hypothetical protein PENSOL_c013G00423 [Penicillium solitum]|uniref:Uncharacterized protein n=1 Tax=Penicillium solitum TaxID=60172 RepID=A0A1V6R6Y1_9EURO|nr:uncharacterized protein PENSOL_c013G00423 [Penicillium solitum]OQD97083.1 hypothetical protein PENSOL_c013G00423 [Penicillium solitum]